MSSANVELLNTEDSPGNWNTDEMSGILQYESKDIVSAMIAETDEGSLYESEINEKTEPMLREDDQLAHDNDHNTEDNKNNINDCDIRNEESTPDPDIKNESEDVGCIGDLEVNNDKYHLNSTDNADKNDCVCASGVENSDYNSNINSNSFKDVENEEKGNDGGENEGESLSENTDSRSGSRLPKLRPKKGTYQVEPDPELDPHLDNAINKHQMPPEGLIHQISQLIQKRRVEAMIRGEYDVAAYQDHLYDVFSNVIKYNRSKSRVDKRVDVLYNRYKLLETQKMQIEQRHKEKIREINRRAVESSEALNKKYKEDVAEINRKYDDPVFLIQFQKPSQRLSCLRDIEKQYALAKIYDQAKATKAEADALERTESEEAIVRIDKQKQFELNQLTLQNERQYQKIMDKKEAAIRVENHDYKFKITPVEVAIGKMPTKQVRFGSELRSSHLLSRVLPTESSMSPETHQILSKYRSEKSRRMLPLKRARTNHRRVRVSVS